jgi:flagellar basal body-associated protein FliL
LRLSDTNKEKEQNDFEQKEVNSRLKKVLLVIAIVLHAIAAIGIVVACVMHFI